VTFVVPAKGGPMALDPVDPHDVGMDFLRTEIETGLTFAGLATAAGNDTEKRERNRANATKALAALEQFLPAVIDVTPTDVQEIRNGVDVLRRAIAAIPV
jgi:hypothetical protein